MTNNFAKFIKQMLSTELVLRERYSNMDVSHVVEDPFRELIEKVIGV